MPTEDIVPQDDTVGELISPDELAALKAAQESEIDSSMYKTPILKIGQPLTREVVDEQAEAGEFINTLTGEGLGDKLGFIVAYYQPGRFAADRKTNRAWVAFGDTIPEAWGEHPEIGEEFVGTRFDEFPDAEEVYKRRANRKEIEWGHGPLVSTTHNFTGLALVSGVDDEPDELQPVRLSLQRTNVPMVGKWLTLNKSLGRNASFWDVVYDLSTFRKTFTQGPAFLLSVKKGRKTTAEEKALAVDLAQAVIAGRVADNATEAGDTNRQEVDAKGGLAV